MCVCDLVCFRVGYDLFAKTRRPELRAFHPKESLKEISTRLKVQWTALPDIDRQRYCQQATVWIIFLFLLSKAVFNLGCSL